MKLSRVMVGWLVVLTLAGCASSMSPTTEAGTTEPAAATSSAPAEPGCAADDVQVALSAEPAWQVCLPSSVKSQLAFGEPPSFRATATLAGSEFVVAKFKIVNDADFAKLNPKAWLQLADNAGSHILIDRGFTVPADIPAAQLAELSSISALLADPLRYSLAG